MLIIALRFLFSFTPQTPMLIVSSAQLTVVDLTLTCGLREWQRVLPRASSNGMSVSIPSHSVLAYAVCSVFMGCASGKTTSLQQRYGRVDMFVV